MSFFGPAIPPSVSGADKGQARAAQDAQRRRAQPAAQRARGSDEVEVSVDGIESAEAARRVGGNAQEDSAQDRRDHPGYQGGVVKGKRRGGSEGDEQPRLDVNG